MALLNKLKSLLGLDEGRSSGDQREDDTVGVTVEHDRSDDRTASESDTGEPPISSMSGSESTDSASVEGETEGSIDEESATDPEEAPPGTDAPGTEMAEPEPAETGESSEDGAGVDGTVDVEGEADAGPSPASDPDSTMHDEGPTDETLQDLKGIGPSYETTLSEAGVETVDELADADADELSNETGLSSKRLQRWIDRASHR